MIIEKDNIPNRRRTELIRETIIYPDLLPIPAIVLFPFFMDIDYIL